jgi:hypothetical protein
VARAFFVEHPQQRRVAAAVRGRPDRAELRRRHHPFGQPHVVATQPRQHPFRGFVFARGAQLRPGFLDQRLAEKGGDPVADLLALQQPAADRLPATGVEQLLVRPDREDRKHAGEHGEDEGKRRPAHQPG